MTIPETDADWSRYALCSCAEAMVTTTASGCVVSWNAAAVRLLGFEEAEIVGKPLAVTVPTRHVEVDQWALRQVIDGQRLEPFETERLRKDGSSLRVTVSISAIQGANEQRIGALYILRPPKAGSALREALRASEERYRSVFTNMDKGVQYWQLVRNPDGTVRTWRLLDVNPATLQAWGRTSEQVLGKLADEIFAGATMVFKPHIETAYALGRAHHFEFYYEPVRQFRRFTCVPLGETFLMTGEDISDQHLELDRLRDEHRRFVAMFDHSPVPMSLCEATSGRYLAVNDAWERLMCIGRDEAAGKTAVELGLIRDQGTRERILQVLNATGRVRDVEIPFHPRNAADRIASINMDPVTLGEARFAVSTIIDITGRLQAESALRDNQLMLDQIFEHAPDAMLLIDADGVVERSNPAAESMFRVPPAQLRGVAVETFVPDSAPQGRSRAYSARASRFARKADGTVFPVDIISSSIVVRDRHLSLLVVRDATDRPQATARMADGG